MQPVFSPVFGSRPVSQYLSFLAVNPSANLIYNYFADEDLETVYNTVDLNASALQPAEAKPWPNEELKTTIYAAFAWRLGVSNFANYGQNGMYRSNLVHRYNGTTYIDSFMKCAVSAYDIRYTWANGTLHSIHAAKFQNGTVLNMWTGLIPYTSNINGGGSQLQDRAQQSAIAGNTTAAYVQKFGELMSQDALSAIGAYTSSRTVLQQQDQRTILVAKVPKLALGLLLACSLLYPLIGAVLVGCAGRASNTTGSTAPLFSYWGLTKAAFVENSAQDEAASVDSSMRRPHYDEDNFRLYVRQQGKEGHQFGLFKRTHTGEIMEIARSQTNHFGGSIILTFVYEQNNTGPPSFLWTPTRSIPKATIFTATEEPTRTIIVPLPTTTSMHTTTTNDNVVGIRDTTSTHQHTPKPLREDITDTFYHRLTHGNDPHTIAIIIEHPTTLNSNVTEPITLLAYINTTLHSSFISSSLVTDLNLSPFIRPITTKPDYLPERDLSTLLGYETYPVGLLYLNLLAGKNNRHREPQFRVIHAPEDTDGTWHPDLVLGMHLLNGLQALQLNEEYSSNDTAAKDGLGVLVQRIFKNSNEDAIMAGHDEL
ncbi:hypothetical protein H2198_010319 [Neophaeococcomyces mojaviensis]|uniref:Uncharacterized protein n=1 Tax=Neophaeococcomyces mojaviensis TaxID=3383035 RepID=A0ACC2ZS05_9EURO|nr:hypothetical protein H2198_010319 [Knufia sp. JES_112]